MNYTTEGEKLLERPLDMATDGSGRYLPGQHQAKVVGDDACFTALLSYVSSMGHAVQMLCCRYPGKPWRVAPSAVAISATPDVILGTQTVPPEFRLSSHAIHALVRAERAFTEFEETFTGFEEA